MLQQNVQKTKTIQVELWIRLLWIRFCHATRNFRKLLVAGVFGFVAACAPHPGPEAGILPAEAFAEPSQVLLCEGAKEGDLGKIDRAIKAGANVNAVGRQHSSALWYALAANEKKAFAKLLEMGGDPNAINAAGDPIIGYCVLMADADYLALCLKHGGNPNALEAAPRRPIVFRAITKDRTDRLEQLLKAGADINARRPGGSSLITYASQSRQMKIVLFLLKKGADPFLRDAADTDVAAGLYSANWDQSSDAYQTRNEVLKMLHGKGFRPDQSVIDRAVISNLAQAAGTEPPMWFKGQKEPNPAWVKAYPHKAEQWYQAVFGRSAPKH